MHGKVSGRAGNPVEPSNYAKAKEAAERFREFTGHRAQYFDTVSHEPIKTGFKIGMVDGIAYTTRRDGNTEHYYHEFKRNSRPTLVSAYDGKKIGIFGGKYHFTERGIEDI